MDRIGLVCRFKPVHLGHAVMLETLCERARHVVIGLGSPNRHDVRNPFTAEETAAMIRLVLEPRFSNWELVPVEDLGHGPRWRALVPPAVERYLDAHGLPARFRREFGLETLALAARRAS